jgi:SpoVK/Ycf46/Vps4 family AAA+-type ATPase
VDEWANRHGHTLSEAARSSLAEGRSLFVLHGPPGVGKTALATTALDEFCRKSDMEGSIVSVRTNTKGNGLVGGFPGFVHKTFDALDNLPKCSVRVLLIDEADALMPRRSGEHQHNEDRVGTASFIQRFDEIATTPYVAAFLTTNLLSSLDPAILRRAQVIRFGRPTEQVRRSLLLQWFPEWTSNEIGLLARACTGKTHADITKALGQAHLDCMRFDAPMTPDIVRQRLRKANKTEDV